MSEEDKALSEKRYQYNQQARKKENEAYELAKDRLLQYSNIKVKILPFRLLQKNKKKQEIEFF